MSFLSICLSCLSCVMSFLPFFLFLFNITKYKFFLGITLKCYIGRPLLFFVGGKKKGRGGDFFFQWWRLNWQPYWRHQGMGLGLFLEKPFQSLAVLGRPLFCLAGELSNAGAWSSCLAWARIWAVTPGWSLIIAGNFVAEKNVCGGGGGGGGVTTEILCNSTQCWWHWKA